jgi:hypothetical protein
MVPLNMRFDGAPNVQGSNIVRMPKFNEGAPYSFSFRVRNEDLSYRDFSLVPGIRMRIKLRPSDTKDFMVLTKKVTNSNFVVSTQTDAGDTLALVLHVSDWAGLNVPRSANHMELDVPFSFVIEFLNLSDVVTERFAQGTGLISIDLAP